MLTDFPAPHAVCRVVEAEAVKEARVVARARGFLAGVIVTLAVWALATLTGCAAVELREENGPLGPASFKVTPLTPPALVHRASRAKRTDATATSPAVSEDECESGVCVTPK